MVQVLLVMRGSLGVDAVCGGLGQACRRSEGSAHTVRTAHPDWVAKCVLALYLSTEAQKLSEPYGLLYVCTRNLEGEHP